jgi:predicted RND superfamily exporter protein
VQASFFERIVAAATRRPVAVVAVVAGLALAGGVLALRLAPSAAPDTLVNRGSGSFAATDAYQRHFGEDAVLILVQQYLPKTVLTADLDRLVGLEGCIAGNVPPGQPPIGGRNSPCAKLSRLRPRPVQVVYGPGTFLNEAVRQIQDQFSSEQRREADQENSADRAARKLAAAQGRSKAQQDQVAREARQLVQAQYLRTALQLAQTYNLRSIPQLNDPEFVSTVVFDPSRGSDVPKARFAYLFPNSQSALIQVRLRPGLTDGQRRQAVGLIEQATRTVCRRGGRSAPCFALQGGGRYVVTGAPVVLAALTTSITNSIVLLLVAALIVMAATLALVFRSRLRLLPLGVALAAAGLTFGAMELAGASLTMASIAVLPVLIGLGVDYAIQFQSRFNEERARAGAGTGAADAARRAAVLGAPTIATAGVATATGFLVLLLSPVPMVRGFGVLLVIGIALAFGCALTAGFAAMVLAARDTPSLQLPAPVRRLGAALASAGRGAGDLVIEGWLLAAGDPAEVGGRDPFPGDPSPAVLRRRAAAWAIDLALLAGAVWLLSGRGLSVAEVAVGGVLAVVAYLVILQGLAGGTLGKLVAGVRVQRAAGGAPGARAAAVRTAALVPDAFGVVALPVMLTAPRRRRLGDRWAGTEVVRDARAPSVRLAAVGRGALGAITAGAMRATRRPARVVGIGVALAVVGLAVDTQTRVVSDVTKLVPQDQQALRDLRALQRTTGVSGEIDLLVQGHDLTQPRAVKWMADFQQRILRRYGYTAARGCGRARLCPALSLPDLFRTTNASGDQKRVRALLDSVPPYFSQAVITRDRRTATLAFGIRLMPLDQQQALIDDMRGRLDPPKGVRARLAGLPVLAAEANEGVSAEWRRLLTLVVGLAAVALVLLAVFRRVERALVPLVPIALASGWSALVLFVVRVPLNPMSVTLGALVIAISTEFSVLLAERYRQERAGGHAPDQALERTYRSTGAAVLASGLTAIAGFAVLLLSDIRMLSDFGFVTVVDLVVSLVGVMLVLPAVLVLAERGELKTLPAQAWRALRGALSRPRRARAAA